MKVKLCLLASICAVALSPANGEPTQKAARRTLALSLEDLNQRFVLAPKETIALQFADVFPGEDPVSLSAPNGGNINGGNGHSVLKSAADLQTVQFTAGASI